MLKYDPMGDRRRAKCQRCGKRRDDRETISWSGLCGDCAKTAVTENIEGLALMTGEPLRRWRIGMAASVGAVLLDTAGDGMHTPRSDAS